VLVEVESPAFAHVMLHESVIVDGIARMRHHDRLVIPANTRRVLEPGGFHLMMPAPEQRLTAGDSVEFELRFAGGRTVRVRAEVVKTP
jgi:copper(I)-binding protein